MASLVIIIITTLISLIATTLANDIHDILPEYGLPVGILPDAVQSYTLSPTDGSFTVTLTTPCYVKFEDQTVYYEKTITGKLTYGSVSDVSGIQAKELFVWLSVSGMEVDDGGEMVQFHVGVLSKKLPIGMFRDVPECRSKAFVRYDQGFSRSI